MRTKHLLAPLFTLFSGAVLFLGSSAQAAEKRTRYIVSFTELPILEQDATALAQKGAVAAKSQTKLESTVRARQLAVLQTAKGLGKAALTPILSTVWTTNTVSLDLTSAEAQQLAQLPGVAAVELNGSQALQTDIGPSFVGAGQIWTAGTRGEGIVVGIIDSGINPGHPSFADLSSDGYNHNNPRGQRFGLCVGAGAARCNDKLIGMWDFTQEAPRDGVDIDGHGSHVASIAIGNPFTGALGASGSVPVPISGVAPRANVISYKGCIKGVNGNPPSCPNDATLAAIDQAARDQVTVFNYSIGGSASDPFLALNFANPIRAMFNARAAGVVITVSAGNKGPVPNSILSPSNAPWVLAVANSSHDRRFVNKLQALSGSVPPPQAVFEGASITGALADAPIVLAERFGNAGCGTGEDLTPPYVGASNPFPPNTFNGQIVVCVRGQQARIAKGANVQLSGAAGMILINTAAEGESIVNDEHLLPAVHLGERDGNRLVAWLRAAQNPRGAIAGAFSDRRASFGDLLNFSSSRGPSNLGFLKPDLSAPGTGIFAANITNGLANLTGTSMAAPHVAGAIALLKARHPSWNPAQLESAVRTSSIPDLLRVSDTSGAANPALVGHGRLAVNAADNALVHFPISSAEFRSGVTNAQAMNLPSIYSTNCFDSCSFTRTIAANPELTSALNFQLSVVDAPPELRATFSNTSIGLSPAGTASLFVAFNTSHPNLLGRYITAKLKMESARQTLLLPVMLYASPGSVPSEIPLNSGNERGLFSVQFDNLIALPRPVGQLSSAVKVTQLTQNLVLDATVSDPYDDNSGQVAIVPAVAAGRLISVNFTGPGDADLYVGRDANADGKASAAEVLCESTGPLSIENCLIDVAVAGSYWIVGQNTSIGIGGEHRISYAVLDPASGAENAVAMPGKVAQNTAFSAQMALEMGGSFEGEQWMSLLQLRADESSSNVISRSLVRVNRTAGANEQPAVIHPGRALSFGLGINEGAKRRIAFDVPMNASAVRINGTSVGAIDAQVIAAPTQETTMTSAPSSPALATAQFVGGTAGLTFAAPAPGRYYLVLSNPQSASRTASANLTLTIESSGAAPALSPQLYYNPSRSGHGLIATQARGDGQFIWYTYDQDNQPTWYWFFPTRYFADNPGSVSGALLRFTWDGSKATEGRNVGTATISRTGVNEFNFAFTVLGQSGSERMVLLGASQCSSGSAIINTDYTGAWYAPSASGWGASIYAANNQEFVPFFVYDQQGNPRWLLGFDDRPNALHGSSARSLSVFQYSGFCPTCAHREATRLPVGNYRFVLDASPRAGTELSGAITLSTEFIAPLSGRFVQTADFALLTGKRSCP